METLCQDLGYGFRMLFKNPRFTAVAVLSLAILSSTGFKPHDRRPP